MLARSCLLSGDSTKDSMSSVIRLLDQTYQRLVCDENNTTSADTPHNDPASNLKQHNLSRSSSRDQNSAKEGINKEHTKDEMAAKEDKLIEPAPNISKPAALVIGTNNKENNNTESYKISTLQNEISSTTSSSSIVSSSLSTTVQPPNTSKTVSNIKVGHLALYNMKNILE